MEISKQDIERINSIPDHEAKILAAAVMYAEQGLPVIPVRFNQKAIPGVKYGLNYSHATNNPKKVAEWFGPNGDFRGWNIGIATGREGGIFVVDLDVKEEADGTKTFENMTPEGWTYQGPMQRTASGGYHLLFNWEPGMRSLVGDLGSGVDCRGGTAESYKGHIVVWPSRVNGKPYDWYQFGQVEEVPAWLRLRMGPKDLALVKGGRGNEHVDDMDREIPMSIQGIQMMLDHMDPENFDHDSWTHVGMAIQSQHPGAEGMDLWDEWSSRDSRMGKDGRPMYDPDLIKAKWKSFDGSKGVRMGTLIYYARQEGFDQAKLKDTENDHVAALVVEMNERFAVVPMGGQMLISEKIEVVKELAATQSGWRFWKREHFRNFLENKTVMAVHPKTGKPGEVPISDIWLCHEDRNEYANGVGLFPGKPPRYKDHLNLWQGLQYEPKKGDWSLFRSHIHDILCCGDEDIYNWVLDWMADLFQDPGNPKGCAVVMHGVEGCGKGTFAQMLGRCFGTHFKHVTDEEHLVGRFNGHLADAVLVFADEAVFGGNRKVAGKIKGLVTEKVITSERKGVDAIQFQNCAHVIVASNEDWFIPAGPQSRRWLVLELSPKVANNREYFNALNKQMENGGTEAMLYDMLEREVTMDLQRAPETEALQEQRSYYVEMDSVKAWYFNCLTLGDLGCAPLRADDADEQWLTEVKTSDIVEAYEEWCKSRPKYYVKSANVLGKFLKSVGWGPTRFKVLGKRVYGYTVPPLQGARELAKYHGYNPTDDYQDQDDD